MSEERINSIALSLINWFSEPEYLLIFSKYHKLELFSDLLSLNTFSRKDSQEVFCKKGVLKNFAKFSRKHLHQSIFLNNVAGLSNQAQMKEILFFKKKESTAASNKLVGFLGLWTYICVKVKVIKEYLKANT